MIKMNNRRKLTKHALKKLQDMLHENVDLLNANDFEKLYDIISPSTTSMTGLWRDINVGDLTYILVQAGLNPLEYMDEIPTRCFNACDNLISVYIPNNIKNISEYAFQNCHNLTSVTIPNSVTIIGSVAFGYCSSLTSIIIPDSVIRIYDYAFFSCNELTNVTIGNGVKFIDHGVFDGCNLLESVIYTGTKKQWRNIKKTNNWRKNSAIKLVKCIDGDIELK